MEESIIKELTATTAKAENNEHRIEKCEARIDKAENAINDIHEVATSVKLMAQEFSYMRTDITEVKETQKGMKTEIESIKEAPLKAKASVYDKIWIGVFSTIGGGVLMYLLSVVAPQIFH